MKAWIFRQFVKQKAKNMFHGFFFSKKGRSKIKIKRKNNKIENIEGNRRTGTYSGEFVKYQRNNNSAEIFFLSETESKQKKMKKAQRISKTKAQPENKKSMIFIETMHRKRQLPSIEEVSEE